MAWAMTLLLDCTGKQENRFTGTQILRKTPVQESLFNKVAVLPATLFKKETLAQVFFCEFCQISKNTFFKEHVWVTASQHWIMLESLFFAHFNAVHNINENKTLENFTIELHNQLTSCILYLPKFYKFCATPHAITKQL